MKEKSYEEALAEQRQHAQVLLGPKAKPKDKKPKKTSKKVILSSYLRSNSILISVLI